MLRENDLEGNPLETLVGGCLEGGACGLFKMGRAVSVLAAGGQRQATDNAALTPEGLPHETEAARSFVIGGKKCGCLSLTRPGELKGVLRILRCIKGMVRR